MLIPICVLLIVAFLACSPLGPGETKTFTLGSGGYRGESVGSCDQATADGLCRDRGYERATDYECRTVTAGTGSFWGSWEQDVMYSVTCWRR
jgi:hypothetical protein